MTKPTRYLIPMLLFLAAIGGLIYVIREPLQRVFLTNPLLNAAILAVLWVGILHMLGRVLRLAPEVRWVELRKRPEAGLALEDPTNLLAPMGAMLRDNHRLALSTASTTSLLDSVGARLEESREISRYLIGLLIFLGLLGTFWGLLDTVGSVSEVIKSLAMTSGDVTKLFADLQAGLRAPLAGMGTAFGSSLFGLSGSLVLGFLDLMAGQSQNRFYNELEEWLAGVTQLSGGDVEPGSPAFLRGLVEQTAERLDNVARALANVESGRARLDATMASVAERLGTVADRFAAQEQLTRRLAEGQIALEPLLQRLAQPEASDADGAANREHLRGIEQSLARLVQAAEAPPPAPVPAPPPETDERALAHLRNLDEALRRLVMLSESPRPGAIDDTLRRHLASIDAALQRLAALGAVAATATGSPPLAPAPAPAAASSAADERALAHLRSLDQALVRLVALAEASRPGGLDETAHRHLASIDAALQSLAAASATGPPPAPAAADTGFAEQTVAQLQRLDDTLSRLVALTEAATAAPAQAPPQVAAVAPDTRFAEQTVAQLQRLDDTLSRLAAAARPVEAEERLQQYLSSIDGALQHLVALGQAAPAATEATPALDGAVVAHLASIDQHLQHIAREAGQIQFRVAQEVRGELRSLAQSFMAVAEEPPPNIEP